ncbi:MAG: hypothetical protein WCA15_16080 [Candidatus Acidiferrales bacterium]
MAHEKLAVEPRGDIAIGIHERKVAAGDAEARDGSKTQKRPVAEKAGDDGEDLGAAAGPQFE